MTATRRFFEMARSKAQRIVYATGKPYDAAISKKHPSLWVAFWRASAALSRAANSPCYLTARLALRYTSPKQQRSRANNITTVPMAQAIVCITAWWAKNWCCYCVVVISANNKQISKMPLII